MPLLTLEYLRRMDPQIDLVWRWREAFGEKEGLPLAILTPADWPFIEEAIEQGDPDIFWARIRAELEAGKIR